MPKYNDPDEQPTQSAIGGNQSSWGPPVDVEGPTQRLGGGSATAGWNFDDPTVRTTPTVPSAADDDDDVTRMPQRFASSGGSGARRNPVGWLVIVKGPGYGHGLPLFYGSNRIGRGKGIEVELNFGDEAISRGAHVRVAYDPKGRTFYLAPGEGTGLTYVDTGPVLAPMPLTSETQFEIGNTTLRFVALCGPQFDWADVGGTDVGGTGGGA